MLRDRGTWGFCGGPGCSNMRGWAGEEKKPGMELVPACGVLGIQGLREKGEG